MSDLKIKPLTKEQILISFDRLTRFKNPEVRYRRVFYDVLTGNLINPKFKKSELEQMDCSILTELAQSVINYSITKLCPQKSSGYSINKRLYEYEKSVFFLSDDAQKLIQNEINYDAGINLITEESPKNLQWLKLSAGNYDNKQLREKYKLGIPVEKIIIAEGATEEILLPEFAKFCNYDFNAFGVKIIPAGGKNQVVKLFYELCEILRIPIFVILDRDGAENAKEIEPKLREKDRIHILKSGEFEDLLPAELIKRTLNDEFRNISIMEKELDFEKPRVKMLEEIFKNRGMHEFKKAEFARMVKNNIKEKTDISPEILQIIKELKNTD